MITLQLRMFNSIVFNFIRSPFYSDTIICDEISFILFRIQKNISFLFLLDGIFLTITQTNLISVHCQGMLLNSCSDIALIFIIYEILFYFNRKETIRRIIAIMAINIHKLLPLPFWASLNLCSKSFARSFACASCFKDSVF